MEEKIIKEKIKELILDNGYKAYLSTPKSARDLLLASSIQISELDWIYNDDIVVKIAQYVLIEGDGAAIALAKEIKSALAAYYESHLEDLFEECISLIAQEKREAEGLRRIIDPVNGEVRYVRP